LTTDRSNEHTAKLSMGLNALWPTQPKIWVGHAPSGYGTPGPLCGSAATPPCSATQCALYNFLRSFTRNTSSHKEPDSTFQEYLCTTRTMYYRSGTGGRCIGARQTLHVHSPGGSTILREMTSWPPSWNCGVKLKIASVTRCVLVTRRMFQPNFIPIRFETTEP